MGAWVVLCAEARIGKLRGMERNTPLTAPQTADAAALYEYWRRAHAGNRAEFFAFMTTPTSRRDAFVASCREVVEFVGQVASLTIIPAEK